MECDPIIYYVFVHLDLVMELLKNIILKIINGEVYENNKNTIYSHVISAQFIYI